MPPSTHAPWRALALRPALTPASAPPTTARLFHTTRALASLDDDVATPPESPNFFSLPTLAQSEEIKLPPVKGALPLPRHIFSKRAHGAHKVSPSFVADTAPLSAAEQAGLPPKSEKDAWKRLMASSRRQALDEGVTALWRRKQRRDAKLSGRAQEKAQRHRAAGFAPERADEVHTRGTVTAATLETRVVRDPNYVERQRQSVLRTAAVQAAKSEARKDAIQRLYVEASQFIVTEADLAARVDAVFQEDTFKTMGKSGGLYGSMNVWQALGKPMPVSSMLQSIEGLTDSYKTDSVKTVQRQKIVTGELTGGALSVTQARLPAANLPTANIPAVTENKA